MGAGRAGHRQHQRHEARPRRRRRLTSALARPRLTDNDERCLQAGTWTAGLAAVRPRRRPARPLRPAAPKDPMADPILVAQHGDIECHLLPALANRHGLITGATGTGKTVTLQTLAESFARIGVPVFMADVKGDLTGISQAGALRAKVAAMLKERGLDAPDAAAPARPRCGTCSASRATRCAPPSPTWARCCWRACSTSTRRRPACCNLVFKIADDNGLLLLDLKDLRAMLQYVGDNASAVHHRVRQRQRRQRRRHPARPAADRGAGRRQVLRRADARHQRLHADRRRPRASSTSWPPTS